jgi:alkanesulfonate monooxygenase SsuD/methylene tetrahydromethanopterin reductase-like flavin-dependent oxidoreductase (luciferase family)
VRFGVVVPNFSTPDRLVELGVLSETHGFDGYFLWDHVHRSPPIPLSDTWTTLAAVAVRTERVCLGSWVTPLPRRRPHVLARQVVTVDHLSQGRAILGVGLGSPGAARSLGEFARFGEDPDPVRRRVLLDEGLQALIGMFSAQKFSYEGSAIQVREATFLPRPVQGCIPIWTACEWPHRAPLRRAALLDGVCPIKIVGGEHRFMTPADVRELHQSFRDFGGDDRSCDIAIVSGPRQFGTVAEYEEAGATWMLIGSDGGPTWEDNMADLIRMGPAPVG